MAYPRHFCNRYADSQAVAKNKEDKETPFAKFLKTDIVLHAAFTVISAACIIFLFNRAF